MAQKKKNSDPNARVVADNRKARFNYEILDTFEAGIQLQGTEVKSLREGRTNIADAYAGERGGELWLYNVHIPEYQQASRFNHELRRPRKLLLHRREINKLMGAIQQDGLTLVPLRLYFNARGMAKVLIGLAKGKKVHDKRESEKKRDWQRDKQRLMRERG
ncbi:MAG: SsrA-binding protein SmpB [Pseudomonadota bacterium]